MRISVCIPVWEAYGLGAYLLKRCLDSLERQTFKDFEVIISDNSEGDELRELLVNYNFDWTYVRNPVRGMASNTNFAMKYAEGELLKILYQDDYFLTPTFLEEISDSFKEEDKWLITASSNNLNPFYSEVNTLGSPSALTLRKEGHLWFADLKWTLDIEFYKRMFKLWGEPKILLIVGLIIGLGSWQETNNLSDEIKRKEEDESFVR